MMSRGYMVSLPQGLKPRIHNIALGAAETVPFPKPSHRNGRARNSAEFGTALPKTVPQNRLLDNF
jgi:hypothetical protein